MKTAQEMYAYCLRNKYEYGTSKNNIKHFTIIEKSLYPDEAAIMCFMALHNYTSIMRHDGIFAYAITNKRIVFAQQKIIGNVVQSVNIDDFNAVTSNIRTIMGIVTIDTSKNTFNIATFKNVAQNISQKIHIVFSELKRPSQDSPIPFTPKIRTEENSTIPFTPKARPVAKNEVKTEKHHITGISHYKDNIMSLAFENDDYDKTKKQLADDYLYDEYVYQYIWDISKIDLLDDPDNPYDSNAVKVMLDDTLVGYIKKGSCTHIKNLLTSDRIIEIDAIVGGGKYKYVYENEDGNGWLMDRGTKNIFVTLEITVKKE